VKRSVLALALLYCVPAGACVTGLEGEGAQRVSVDAVSLIFRLDPLVVVLGEPFGVDLAACHAAGRPLQIVRIDAQMPEHRHGMNYEPSLRATDSGRTRADGLLFHMPGRWQFSFDIKDGVSTRQLTADYVLE
jgi:hypothetical protein